MDEQRVWVGVPIGDHHQRRLQDVFIKKNVCWVLTLFRPTFAIEQDYFTMCLYTIYQLTIRYLSTGLVPRCQHFWFFQLKRKLSFNLLIHLGCHFLGIRTHHVGTLLPTLVSREFHLNPTRFSQHTPMVVTDL